MVSASEGTSMTSEDLSQPSMLMPLWASSWWRPSCRIRAIHACGCKLPEGLAGRGAQGRPAAHGIVNTDREHVFAATEMVVGV